MRPDTAQDIASRIANNARLEMIRAEMAAKYPKITAENVDEALAYQEQRMRETDPTLKGGR
jgi:uncharacterized protein (DUF433 family)